MSRGILHVLWDNRRPPHSDAPFECYEELVSSVTYSRKEALPIALVIDARQSYPYLDRSLFDKVISYDFGPHQTENSNSLFRKSFMFDLSPFEETLYLDSDCVINDGSLPLNEDYPEQPPPPDLEFGFERARKHGLAIAYDSHVMGQREHQTDSKTGDRQIRRIYPVFADKVGEILGRSCYLPCFNSGVVFFNNTISGVKDVFDLSNTYAVGAKCNDQVALTIAIEKIGFHPHVLPDRVWNCRMLPGRSLPWPGVKISHNQYWREYLKTEEKCTEKIQARD